MICIKFNLSQLPMPRCLAHCWHFQSLLPVHVDSLLASCSCPMSLSLNLSTQLNAKWGYRRKFLVHANSNQASLNNGITAVSFSVHYASDPMITITSRCGNVNLATQLKHTETGFSPDFNLNLSVILYEQQKLVFLLISVMSYQGASWCIKCSGSGRSDHTCSFF